MKRKICVVTGSRSEYGLLRFLMEMIRNDTGCELQVIATGSHLSSEFGTTYQEIEKDGFQIKKKIEILLSSDTNVGVTKSMGLALISFAEALNELQPDLIVLLGDRFEIFAAATAALIARIPVAHLHGGEITEGAFDDALRHSISKMSHLHFVAAEPYRKRLIQLGENPDQVHTVGGLGVDAVKKLKLMSKTELAASLGFQFREKNLIVTFHPATLDAESPEHQMQELLDALSSYTDTGLIFTMPNADTGSRGLIQMLEAFVGKHENAILFQSLGQLRYFSCLAIVDGMVGNSSSGLLEMPAFRKGTVNIGDRQKGRIKATSVIDCEPRKEKINAAIDRLYSALFRKQVLTTENPFGNGNASDKILGIIRSVSLAGITGKKFCDLKFDAAPGSY